MKIVMTLLVRDEVDIIAANLDWHLGAGVDFFVVVDNCSIDGTRELLREYERAGVLAVRDEDGRNHDQAAWMTRAAMEARDMYGADWIISSDADELWMCPGGSYRDFLADIDSAVGVLKCPRQNMFCSADDLPSSAKTNGLGHLCYRVGDPPRVPVLANIYSDGLELPYFYYNLPPKVIVRGAGLEEVFQGNHGARHHGADMNFGDMVTIRHFPVRSRVQFERKITQGAKACIANPNLSQRSGWHWRRWYRMILESGIDASLRDAIPTRQELDRDLATGFVSCDSGPPVAGTRNP